MPKRRFSKFAVIFFIEVEISHLLPSPLPSSRLGLNLCAWWPEFLHAQFCRFPCISSELKSVFICEMLTVNEFQKLQKFRRKIANLLNVSGRKF